MLCNFIFYIVIFHIKFIFIISKNHRITNNGLKSILKVYWLLIKSNILRFIIGQIKQKCITILLSKIFLINLFRQIEKRE